VVLPDFWTCCRISCLHILPELRSLEEKYPGGWRSRYNAQNRRPSGDMFRRVVREARPLLD